MFWSQITFDETPPGPEQWPPVANYISRMGLLQLIQILPKKWAQRGGLPVQQVQANARTTHHGMIQFQMV